LVAANIIRKSITVWNTRGAIGDNANNQKVNFAALLINAEIDFFVVDLEFLLKENILG
jgi:hypothetical protein